MIKKFKSFNENTSEEDNYMFFSNLESIKRRIDDIMSMNKDEIDTTISSGHDWVNDHISKSMESIEHVYNFLKNQ